MTADPVPDCKPPGWHKSIAGAHPYIPYYNRAAVLPCTVSGVAVVSCGALDVLRRCDVFQRGEGGIIAAYVGLVSAAVEWGKPQEKRI